MLAILASHSKSGPGAAEAAADQTVAGRGAAGDGEGIALSNNAAIGAQYGAAGPRCCSPKNVPAKGPPSLEQAAQYVICAREGVSDNTLYLVANTYVSAIGAPEA